MPNHRRERWPLDDDDEDGNHELPDHLAHDHDLYIDLESAAGLPDTDSEEDALRRLELEEPPTDEADPYKSAILIEEIADEVGSVLKRYGWGGADDMDGEKFLALCETLGVAPEPLRAMVAMEDVGFAVERKNYEARTLEQAPTIGDITEEGVSVEDIDKYQEESTIAAYRLIRHYVADPIIDREIFRARKATLLEKIRDERAKRPQTMEEYDQQQETIGELNGLLDVAIKRLDELGQIEEIVERRERAFRRMRWLMRQDIFAPGFKAFFDAYKEGRKQELQRRKAELEAQGEDTSSLEVDDSFYKPDFGTLAGFVAGKYEEVIEIPQPQVAEPSAQAEEVSQASLPHSSEGQEPKPPSLTKKYWPGMVDKLLDEQRKNMIEGGERPPAQVKRDKIRLRRLEQAKAICESIFQNDISDRIYNKDMPISAKEYEMLGFVRDRLYVHGDLRVLDEVLSFLPGSHLRTVEDPQIDNVPLTRKLSGRSKLELIKDIDTIVNEHPDMDIEGLTELMQSRISGNISRADDIELAVSALKILEKLVFKEGYSARNLLSPS